MATHREIRERKSEIAQAFEDGMPLEQIRRSFGITDEYLRQCLTTAGLKRLRELRLEERRQRRSEAWAAEHSQGGQTTSASHETRRQLLSPRDTEIIELALSGHTLQEIGDRLSLSRERVRQILGRSNLSVRELRKSERKREDETSGRIDHQIELLVQKFPGILTSELVHLFDQEEKLLTRALHRHRLLILTSDELPIRQLTSSHTSAIKSMKDAAIFSNPLTGGEYERLRKSGRFNGLSHVRIVQLFGSWSQACAAAGVEHGESARQSEYSRHHSDENILLSIAEFLRAQDLCGANGSVRAYDEWRDSSRTKSEIPSSATIRWRISPSWDDARNIALHHLRSEWISQDGVFLEVDEGSKTNGTAVEQFLKMALRDIQDEQAKAVRPLDIANHYSKIHENKSP